MMSRNLMSLGWTSSVVIVAFCLTISSASARSGPFSRMAGTWLGAGRVVLSDGQVERIRCRATDEVGGEGDFMRQHLRCASPSYNFDVQNAVTAHQNAITGSWEETTHNVGGQVVGTASADLVRARVEGGQFDADVTLASRGNALMVTLLPHRTDVREVAVMLRRP